MHVSPAACGMGVLTRLGTGVRSDICPKVRTVAVLTAAGAPDLTRPDIPKSRVSTPNGHSNTSNINTSILKSGVHENGDHRACPDVRLEPKLQLQ